CSNSIVNQFSRTMSFLGDIWPSHFGKHPSIAYRVPGTDSYISFIFRKAYVKEKDKVRYACATCMRTKK
ncbi:hypothetical protein PFISCL1PPCAC_26952, partial [Pristionchus fissidentatus]